MSEFQVINPQIERAIIVGAQLRSEEKTLSLEDSLTELSLLAKTAGIEIVGKITQTLNQIDPATYIGSGKVLEVIDVLEETGAKTVIFDDELSPRHQRQLNNRFGEEIKLLDRSALILDIFAQHASTREGSLQVELAQYEYRLPRLTRQWTHLARQAGGGGARGGSGGVGLRGPGETQLEVDKREIGRKISKLKVDIEKVRQHRSQYRQQRVKTGIPVIALVGYTNAGKSTLLRSLTNDDIYVADQLFATLDPTTRRIALPSGRDVLLTDTVGFIQKLPTTLVVAFRATLEEITSANVIVHVVDVSHPNYRAHIEAVEDTLAEIDVPALPRVLVWNKIDRVDADVLKEIMKSDVLGDDYIAQVGLSALEGQGTDGLLVSIEDALSHSLRRLEVLIPHERGDLVSMLFSQAQVIEQEYIEEGVRILADMSPALFMQFIDYEYDV
jgi:GTP-binding protein HflX